MGLLKEIILEKDFAPDNLSLFGLKLGDSVDKIQTDKENRFQYGSLWIGTDGEGLNRVLKNKVK